MLSNAPLPTTSLLPVALLLLAGLPTAAEAAPASDQRPAIGDPAPSLAATDVDGKAYSLADSAAGPTIVVFFRGAW